MSKRSRNAPCPCGSGKKYKRCHAYSTANRLAIDSRKQPIAPSVAGVSPKANAIIEITRHLANKARRDIAGNSAISASRMIGTFWFAKAAKSFDAACLLWEHGYWQDAAAVARTILELAYQARYFKTDPSTFAPQFFAHAENQLHDLYRKFYGFADEQLKPEISEYFRQLGVKSQEVTKWKNWWGEKSTLSEMVKLLNAQGTYVSQYESLSFIVHGSPAAFRFYIFGQDGAVALVDSRGQPPHPRIRELAETIFVASALYLLDVIAALAEVWPFDYSADLKSAADTIEHYMSADPQKHHQG